jgi:hypothetical protein
MTVIKTMTNAQMCWNLKKGFAWFEVDANGNPCDDWRSPIWTREGEWFWDTTTQLYELVR